VKDSERKTISESKVNERETFIHYPQIGLTNCVL
jgi:hypothetical protein